MSTVLAPQLWALFLLSRLGEEVAGLAVSFTSLDTVTLFLTLLSSPPLYLLGAVAAPDPASRVTRSEYWNGQE